MIKKTFTVLHDDDSSFVDNSYASSDFGTEGFDIEIVAAEDNLYVGFHKQFNMFYVDMGTANENANTITAKYYDKDDEDWKALTIVDETEGLTKSGFIYWDKPKNANGDYLWEENTVNSIEQYWVQFSFSADHSASVVNGLGIVFSNDNDLIEERSDIVSKYNSGNSWILKHQSAAKDIIQFIRNAGNTKRDTDYNIENITEFDILEPFELRQASKYLVLSKIFLQEISDSEEDKYFKLGMDFKKKYKEAMNLYLIKVDKDDDGTFNEYGDQAKLIGHVYLNRR